MPLRLTKAPFAIGAIAAVLTLTTAGIAKAGQVAPPLSSAPAADTQVEEVGFKIKKRGFHHRGFKRHRSFHHRGFRHHRGFHHRSVRNRGFVHRPKARSRVISKKRF